MEKSFYELTRSILYKNRLALICLGLALSMGGCDNDSSSSSCDKSEEICTAESKSFDADNCECVEAECDISEETCAASNKDFDSANCSCVAKKCDKTEKSCADENKDFDPDKCACVGKKCDKTEKSCADENKDFDPDNCACVEKTCDKSEESCAAEDKSFDADNCACVEKACDKSEESCAAEYKSFDADNCACVEKTCDKSEEICAVEDRAFDESLCACIVKDCDKTEETCAAENKSFDIVDCACVEKTCDKSEEICAAEDRAFDESLCACIVKDCDKTEETCAEDNKTFNIVDCECVERACDKSEAICAAENKLFDADKCACVEKACDKSEAICAADNKDFDADKCACVEKKCPKTEESCAAEGKKLNADNCVCDLVCDGVKKGHKLDPNATVLKYSEFGAVGDGKTEDLNALIKTHECANKYHLNVKADKDATYYVAAMEGGAIVKTDTDWTGANFIIDDSKVGIDKRGKNLFNVRSDEKEQCLVGTAKDCPNKLKTLKRHQNKIDGLNLPKKSIVMVVNNKVKQYIREGLNQNDGTDQQDIIVVDKEGNVDKNAPIMWDYKEITSAKFIPMDEKPLTLKGGTFTTIANQAESKYNYYARGINIQRSNVTVDGLVHYVKGELDHGAPYSGILTMSNCANILVKNSTFTAHKTYKTIGSAGKEVSMGTYDIGPARVIHLTFDNCKQTTDILDTNYWGIMGSNFCKDIVVKDCTFSRFDAHQGVANVTITGSKLGHQCLNAIGEGLLKVENSTLYGSSFINLRSDYGSTWHGDVEIKNCTWVPKQGKKISSANLIGGSFTGQHYFGYECYMPTTITIDGLTVDDSKHDSSYGGIYLLGDITKVKTAADEKAMKYKYHVTETINIKNFSSASKKKWRLSSNTYMYRNVKVNEK
ncbi:MAG: hypothetical protein IJM59_01340 [Proteobacteria bacterium]|nr:hypothetical protein [Pseudomonadota bacterium]